MNKSAFHILAASLVSFLCGCAGNAAETAVTIAPERSVIVATRPFRKAAEELQRHLELISGICIPIREKDDSGSYVFLFDGGRVGDSQEACAWKVGAKKTVFSGNGYFAAVDFLENALGVRWPEGSFVSYRTANPIVIGKLSGCWNPQIKIRTIRSAASDVSNAVFSARMRRGSHDRPIYGHAFTQYWTRFGREHPEYFAMRKDGLRGPAKVSPDELGDVAVYMASRKNRVAICCVSTGLVDQVVTDWRDAGMGEYINICENDVTGSDSCHCRGCAALDVVPSDCGDPTRETYYADRYVYFGNRVLEAARRYRHDVKVCYYAYNATQDAPKRQRPDSSSYIGLVPTVFSYQHITNYVSSWKKTGVEHFFYRPNQHHYFQCPYLPIGSEEHFFNVMQYMHSQGTIGFDYDAHGAVNGGFEWLERYVIFHAMQDPGKPFSYWEDHYCSAYGAAADDIKAYFRYWRDNVWNSRLEPDMGVIIAKGKWFNFGRGLVHNLKDYYRMEDFCAAERHLVAAESRDLPRVQRDLVRRLRIAHDHARLFFQAVANKSEAATMELVDYRRKFGYPLTSWSESYFGDIAGIEGLLGIKYKKDARK